MSNKENSDDRAETVIRQWRLRRSETDPGLLDKRMDKSFLLPSLPENPKLWTPAQLSQYLLTALRFKGNNSDEVVSVPKPVAQDIANFVVKYKLNGRAFLRLEDKDIEEMGINQLWRTALLSSSLELRKSMLKGRIWGFGPDDDVFAAGQSTEQGRRVPSTVLEREEVNAREFSSTSYVQPTSTSQDLSTLRSGGYLSPSSSTLSFDSDVSNNTPSRRSTRPRAESASSNASSSVGRVRGIVRNLEQAASSSGDVTQGNEDAGFASSEMSSESDEDPEPDAVGNITIIGHGPEDRTIPPESNQVVGVVSPSTSQSSRTSRASTSELIKTPPPPSLVGLLMIAQSSDSSPSNLPGQDFSEPKGTPDEEPTIEALLKEGEPCEGRPRAISWGAKAWEDEFPGGTSRRVPAASAVAPAKGAEPVANIERSQDEMIKVPRTAWDNLCRRLEETERRIALLEIQEVERRNEPEIAGKTSDDHDAPKSSLPGGLSAATLPPYLVIVGVGVCALVAQYVFGCTVGRRPRL